MVLAKLLFQLNGVKTADAFNVSEQQWAGFAKTTSSDVNLTPAEYVKYYMITLVILLLQRISVRWHRAKHTDSPVAQGVLSACLAQSLMCSI